MRKRRVDEKPFTHTCVNGFVYAPFVYARGILRKRCANEKSVYAAETVASSSAAGLWANSPLWRRRLTGSWYLSSRSRPFLIQVAIMWRHGSCVLFGQCFCTMG